MKIENYSDLIEQKDNLRGADLRGIDLSGTDLSDINLREADLSNADLSGACLRNTDLSGACLIDANLRGSILSNANLNEADLSVAGLSYANLSGTDLSHANLYNANLSETKNVPDIPYNCPESGSFIGYKTACGYIVQLQILSDARRSSGTTRKCRCDKAKVIDIQNKDGTSATIKSICSDFDKSFIYKVGEIVEEPNFDGNRWNECSKGIHFFITRQEAVEYGNW